LLFVFKKSPKGIPPEWEEISAVAMAVQNMWLACTALKNWCVLEFPVPYHHLDEFFNFNEGESCLGFFYMGKLDGELLQGKRKSSIDDKVEYL